MVPKTWKRRMAGRGAAAYLDGGVGVIDGIESGEHVIPIEEGEQRLGGFTQSTELKHLVSLLL